MEDNFDIFGDQSDPIEDAVDHILSCEECKKNAIILATKIAAPHLKMTQKKLGRQLAQDEKVVLQASLIVIAATALAANNLRLREIAGLLESSEKIGALHGAMSQRVGEA